MVYTNPIHIRRAVSADAESIKKIHTTAIKQAYQGYLPDTYLNSLIVNDQVIERTQHYLEQPDTECYVAVVSGQVVGFMYVTNLDQTCVEITLLCVDPSNQRKGVGSVLVNRLCDDRQKYGFQKCVAWTVKQGPATGFYLKSGFNQNLNQEKKHYACPDVSIVLFERDIF